MGGSRSCRAVFSRLWEAYGQGRLDALHPIDPDRTLHVSGDSSRAEALAAAAELRSMAE